MKIVINSLYLLVAIAISPRIIYRAIRQGRYRTGWAQRFGRIKRFNPEKKCLWLHAVSVGEVNAARTVIDQLEKRFPDYEIVISTTTDTGHDRAIALFAPDHKVFYFPLDFSPVMRRAFDNIKPTACLLVELEVWPNFIDIARESNIPVIVINGRISEKSFLRYEKIKPVAKKIFSKLSLTLAQTRDYAHRFEQIGCQPEKIIITGSLKYDTAEITDNVAGSDELAQKLDINKTRLIVAGATGNDEEEIILTTYRRLIQDNSFADIKLAIVPRKPERFDHVAQLIEQQGFSLIRYSDLKDSDTKAPPADNKTIILGDTMGDLRKFYSLATIIFVGRSLVPMGGSDMIEAAALGKCTIFGPHAFNFKQTVDDLLDEGGAIMVNDADGLWETLRTCLLDPDYAQKIAAAGRETIKQNQGATTRSIDHIQKLLKPIA